MLKTIPEREFESLQEALPNYHKMMQQNPDSLLSRFYGMFRIRWTENVEKKTRYLVVMNNVFKDFKVGNRFDLKGSSAGREALKGTEMKPEDLQGIAMKDNDFKKYYKNLNLIDNQDEIIDFTGSKMKIAMQTSISRSLDQHRRKKNNLY